MKTKTNKWDLIKLKKVFTTAKETTDKMKRKPVEWGKNMQTLLPIIG